MDLFLCGPQQQSHYYKLMGILFFFKKKDKHCSIFFSFIVCVCAGRLLH